jgi:hypothetical protein
VSSGSNPSESEPTPNGYELLLLTSAVLCDARRAHDEADLELESWHTILHQVA